MRTLDGEVVEQPPVGRVAGLPRRQLVELRAEVVSLGQERGSVHRASVVGVAQRQRAQDTARRCYLSEASTAELTTSPTGKELQVA